MQPTSTASNPLFDRDFLLATMMGPNCVRFAEELTANIPFSPNMRVLDLGCGMGLSSIYLARTFGVRVFAADLWINPSDNFARFRDFGLEDAVIPLRAEGHALPFAEGYFDAVICIDAYHFFGCDPEYLDAHIAPLVKPGGFIAAAIPGLRQEFTGDIPDELRPYWKVSISTPPDGGPNSGNSPPAPPYGTPSPSAATKPHGRTGSSATTPMHSAMPT